MFFTLKHSTASMLRHLIFKSQIFHKYLIFIKNDSFNYLLNIYKQNTTVSLMLLQALNMLLPAVNVTTGGVRNKNLHRRENNS